MARNAARPDDIKRGELAELSADLDLKWIMADPHGRRFIWRQLGDCGLYRLGYSANNSEHCFNAGARNVALRLQADVIRVSPEHYLTMQQEAIEQDHRNALAEQRDNENG